jgi:uncharacterized protein YjbI with pentapeptide repeats
MKWIACILLCLILLTGAQAGDVWKGQERLSESQRVDLLVTAIGDHITEQPLAGIVFSDFCDAEFYSLVRQADEKRLGKPLAEAELKDWQVKINFESAIFDHVAFQWLAMPQARFNQAKFTDVVFRNCDLTRARFEHSQFIRAWFLECNLTNVSFDGEEGASKRQSERRSTKPSEISFDDSNLTDCNFKFSWMARVEFDRCFLSNANMAWAKFDSTMYDPMPNSLPFLPSFATFQGLPDFFYQTSPTGITELRNAFKNAGLRREERQITAALCRQQMREGGRWEGRWKRLVFDLPSAFGMFPGRPLRILLCLCLVFTLPYTWAILRPTPKLGEEPGAGENWIWQVPLEKRVSSSDSKPRLLHVDIKKLGLVRGLTWALLLGFFFSLISAFGAGYRDLDVGRWIERIKRDESTLRATGWLRTVSGVQGLMSFYLLVLWLLTYFGRPFE